MKFEFFRQKLENVVNEKLHFRQSCLYYVFDLILRNLKTSKHWLILIFFKEIDFFTKVVQ